MIALAALLLCFWLGVACGAALVLLALWWE